MATDLNLKREFLHPWDGAMGRYNGRIDELLKTIISKASKSKKLFKSLYGENPTIYFQYAFFNKNDQLRIDYNLKRQEGRDEFIGALGIVSKNEAGEIFAHISRNKMEFTHQKRKNKEDRFEVGESMFETDESMRIVYENFDYLQRNFRYLLDQLNSQSSS